MYTGGYIRSINTHHLTKEKTMELLMLVVGLVLLWKFSSTLSALSIILKSTTEVKAESIIADCVIERTENFTAFKEKVGDAQIYSHEEVMSAFKVD